MYSVSRFGRIVALAYVKRTGMFLCVAFYHYPSNFKAPNPKYRTPPRQYNTTRTSRLFLTEQYSLSNLCLPYKQTPKPQTVSAAVGNLDAGFTRFPFVSEVFFFRESYE